MCPSWFTSQIVNLLRAKDGSTFSLLSVMQASKYIENGIMSRLQTRSQVSRQWLVKSEWAYSPSGHLLHVLSRTWPHLLFFGSFSYREVYSRRNLNVCPPMYDTVVWTIPPTHLKNVSLVQLVSLPPINCFFLVCLHQNDPINLYLHSCAEEHGLEWETLMRINAGWLTISVSSSLCL